MVLSFRVSVCYVYISFTTRIFLSLFLFSNNLNKIRGGEGGGKSPPFLRLPFFALSYGRITFQRRIKFQLFSLRICMTFFSSSILTAANIHGIFPFFMEAINSNCPIIQVNLFFTSLHCNSEESSVD